MIEYFLLNTWEIKWLKFLPSRQVEKNPQNFGLNNIGNIRSSRIVYNFSWGNWRNFKVFMYLSENSFESWPNVELINLQNKDFSVCLASFLSFLDFCDFLLKLWYSRYYLKKLIKFILKKHVIVQWNWFFKIRSVSTLSRSIKRLVGCFLV